MSKSKTRLVADFLSQINTDPNTGEVISSSSYTDSALTDLVNSAPEDLDTLGEIATELGTKVDKITFTGTSVGSASQVPVLTINDQGQITAASETAVAGVSSTSFDASTGVLTINTSDGGSHTADLGVGTADSPTFTNTTLTGYLRGPAEFVIDPAAHGDNTGKVVIAGDLQVDGTTTTINSTTITVDDLSLVLGADTTSDAEANGASVSFGGHASAPLLTYNSTTDLLVASNTLGIQAGTFYGALAGTAANAGALDNLDSTQFLRSDQSDTLSGTLTVTGTSWLQGNVTTPNIIITDTGSTLRGIARNNDGYNVNIMGGSAQLKGSWIETNGGQRGGDGNAQNSAIRMFTGSDYENSQSEVVGNYELGVQWNGGAKNLMTIDSSSGNVGIGTNQPQNQTNVTNLAVDNATWGGRFTVSKGGVSKGGLAWDTYRSTGGELQVFGEGGMKFRVGGDPATAVEAMRIDSTGGLTLGATASPSGNQYIQDPKFHVRGDNQSGYGLVARFHNGTDVDNSGAAILINHDNDRGLLIEAGRQNSDRGIAHFGVLNSAASNTRMLTLWQGSAGQYNVGIGTETPNSKLEIRGNYTDGQLRVSDTSSHHTHFRSGSGYGGIGTDSVAEIINWRTDNSTGYVGIGTNTPDQKLDVRGNVQIYTGTGESRGQLVLRHNASAGNNPGSGRITTQHSDQNTYSGDLVLSSYWYSGSAYGYRDTMTVSAHGRIGINTLTPYEELTIKSAGGAGADNTMRFDTTVAAGHSVRTFLRSYGSNGTFEIDVNPGQNGDSDFIVKNLGSERFKIDNTETVINELGLNKDFRVESDTQAHCLYVDGGTSQVSINTNEQVSGVAFKVNGVVQHNGVSPTSGFAIDQVYTVTKSIQVTTDWQDTGIDSSEITAAGTYLIQMYVDNYDKAGQEYQEYYSGVMSWRGSTNSTVTDEIMLHAAGHAPNAGRTYLRTRRSNNADGGRMYLQIKGTLNLSAADNYVFKFRRMM